MDDALVCTARNVAQLLPAGMAYQYLFAYGNPTHGNTKGQNETNNFVSHCTQNAFVFDNAPRLAAPGYGGDAAAEVGGAMATFWANVAKSGKPNTGAKNLPTWSAYTNSSDKAMRFGRKGTVTGNPE